MSRFVSAIALILFALVATSSSTECGSDDDCLPSTCCHATSCVHKSKVDPSKDCSVTLCRAKCEPFTLDCGGECRCISRNCSSVIRAGRAPPGVEYVKPVSEAPKGYSFVKVIKKISVPRSEAMRLRNKRDKKQSS
ncbi:Hypothetical protein, putative [Bodo saltans]|uniref:Membrane-associated protein n=1 Tax=Bodo saltans TaxID=75058 RepID=A0A0S4JKT5_BODSA|nr:Hypothetical protein, putative [Bodo saltans]|eukprot:CUG90851.1 Hypothetical protein, putative [Bodo saltans]